MTTESLKVLLLADTHLGFDEPRRPRVQRRCRGPDFWANYERALAPARRGDVDLVVHGGDLLFRSKVRAPLVDRALEPLRQIADGGVPVVHTLGNHERSCDVAARQQANPPSTLAVLFAVQSSRRGPHRPAATHLHLAGLDAARLSDVLA